MDLDVGFDRSRLRSSCASALRAPAQSCRLSAAPIPGLRRACRRSPRGRADARPASSPFVASGSSRGRRFGSDRPIRGVYEVPGTRYEVPKERGREAPLFQHESGCKPDSVPAELAGDGHLSMRPTWNTTGGPPCSVLALLPVGFTEPLRSPATLVVSYTTVSPLPADGVPST